MSTTTTIPDEAFGLMSEFIAEQNLSAEEKRLAWKIVYRMVGEVLGEHLVHDNSGHENNGVISTSDTAKFWSNVREEGYDLLDQEIGWGKHAEETWGEVDVTYLEWCAENFDDGANLRMIETALELRK